MPVFQAFIASENQDQIDHIFDVMKEISPVAVSGLKRCVIDMGFGLKGGIEKAFPDGNVDIFFCWVHLDRAFDRNMNKNKGALHAAKALKHCSTPAMFHLMYRRFINLYGETKQGRYFIRNYGLNQLNPYSV